MNWRTEFESTAQRYALRVVGIHDVYNEAQAAVVLALLAVYGNAATGAIYIEPTLAHSSQRPPDIVLLHKAVGVLVLEVKGYPLTAIHSVEAGSFRVQRNGQLKEENPIRQAQQTVFEIRNALQRLGVQNFPLINSLAALPRISETEWNTEGYEGVLPREDVLFQEDIESPKRLQHWIEGRIQYALRKTGKTVPMTPHQFNQVMAVFGGSRVIAARRPADETVQAETLGAEVAHLYALDKSLSKEQQVFSRVEVRGRQRLFRGVAGSGKSVILAQQVARLLNRHLYQGRDLFDQEPTPLRVAVICFNRTLVPFLREKIQAAYYEQTLDEELPASLFITHLNGFLYELSGDDKETKELTYISTYQIHDPQARATAYLEQLQMLKAERPQKYAGLLFDAIFVDEGQDFLPEEYQLLLDLLRPDPTTGDKSLTIFYDDAQNIYARQRPNWKEIGINVVGRSEVMKQCFRNPREIVELAFNVLIGSQAPETMRVQTRAFADLEYLKRAELVDEQANHVRIGFAQRSDARFLPQVQVCEDRQAEKQWLVGEVQRLLTEEQVHPEDILILFHKTTPFEDLSMLLQGVAPSVKGCLTPYKSNQKDSYLFQAGYVTLSTPHSAKGYDAPIVFVVGTDLFPLDNQGRASFYVGVTRAKVRVYLTGMQANQHTLLDEVQGVLARVV